MAHTDFQNNREGVVYATKFVKDVLDAGPFKLGESYASGTKRLKDSKTYVLEQMVSRMQWKFYDRIWAEFVLFKLLAQYRVPRQPGERKEKEFFKCSLEIVKAAILEVYRLQEVQIKAMRRGLEYIAGASELPNLTTSHFVLNGVLGHRMLAKRTLADLAHDAWYAPMSSAKILRKIQECGMYCLPIEKLIIFRIGNSCFDEFLKGLGFQDWKKQLGNIVGFDNDGNPVSSKEFKTRCPGYDHASILA